MPLVVYIYLSSAYIVPHFFQNASPLSPNVHERKKIMQSSPFRKLFPTAGILLLIWLCLRYLMPIITPFLLAVLLALLAEPLVRILSKKAKLPRSAATGIGVTMTLALLLLLIIFLFALLLRQLRSLAGIVPSLEDTAIRGLDSLQLWLTHLVENMPRSIRPMAARSVDDLFSNGSAVIDRIAAWLLSLATNIVSKLPDSLLGFGTWLLASFMISAKLPKIKDWLRSHLPKSWFETYLPMLKRLKKAIGGWLWAQCKLIGITFLVLTIGFFLLQISYAPVWAALISLVDALPVLGTGIILVPWSFICFLQGNSIRAIGLLGTYVVAVLLRSVLEPRFVGKQLGLDPLVTLFSMYAGYRLFGLGGMILSPLLAVTATQLLVVPEKNSQN
jgi:sporulation integral membrane protein YtvI